MSNKIANVSRKPPERTEEIFIPICPLPTETFNRTGGRESTTTQVFPVLSAQRSCAIRAVALDEDYVGLDIGPFLCTRHLGSVDITDRNKQWTNHMFLIFCRSSQNRDSPLNGNLTSEFAMKYHRTTVPRPIGTTGESGRRDWPISKVGSHVEESVTPSSLQNNRFPSYACCPNPLHDDVNHITHGNAEYKRIYKAVPFFTYRHTSVTTSANALDTVPPSFPAFPTYTVYGFECHLPR